VIVGPLQAAVRSLGRAKVARTDGACLAHLRAALSHLAYAQHLLASR
jgi:hypothetical protein